MYRAPMRAQLDLPARIEAAHGIAHGLVGAGDALNPVPATLGDAVETATRRPTARRPAGCSRGSGSCQRGRSYGRGWPTTCIGSGGLRVLGGTTAHLPRGASGFRHVRDAECSTSRSGDAVPPRVRRRSSDVGGTCSRVNGTRWVIPPLGCGPAPLRPDAPSSGRPATSTHRNGAPTQHAVGTSGTTTRSPYPAPTKPGVCVERHFSGPPAQGRAIAPVCIWSPEDFLSRMRCAPSSMGTTSELLPGC